MIYDFETEFAASLPSNLQPLDHLECLPERVFDIGGRFKNHPTFEPVTFEPRSNVAAIEWTNARLVSIDPQSFITHNRAQITFSARSIKTNSVQSGESPWEYHLFKELEVDPNVASFQMHGIRLDVDTALGPKSYSPDAVWVDRFGKTVVAEVKASDSYFNHPDHVATFSQAGKALTQLGIEFRKYSMERERRRARRAFNISRIYMDRASSIPLSENRRIIAAIEDAGGVIERGRLKEAMRSPGSARERILNSMLCRSLLDFDIDTAITDMSRVSIRKSRG